MKRKLLLLIIFIVFPCITFGQSIWTNPIGNNSSGSNPYTTGQTVDPNITVSGIGRASALIGSNVNGRYAASNWTGTTAINLNNYFEFTLTPNSGIGINFVSLEYDGQISGSGGNFTNFAIRSSIDGFSSNISTPGSGGGTISLSAAAFQGVTSAITFRIYAWGAATSRVYGINDFTFNGTICRSAATTTPTIICQGDAATINATSTSAVTGNTFSGSWNGGSDPTARIIASAMNDNATCAFGNTVRNYTTINFTVNTTGNYVFKMADTDDYDGMAYIYTGNFTPGTCSGGGTWIRGDDDHGTLYSEPRLTTTLTAGVVYTLISTTYSNNNGTYSGNYSWSVTAPAGGQVTLLPIEWYTASTGGTFLGGGSPFNPVGVAGSGLPNTNTPGPYTFYAQAVGACTRTPVTLTINPKATINAMTATICSGGTFTVTPVNGTNGTVPANTTYSWAIPTMPDGVKGAVAGSGASNISGTLTNINTTSQNVVYAVTPLTGSCSGTPFNVTVTVNPSEINNKITLAGSTQTCDTAAEGGNASLVAPAGTYFNNVSFASYGLPNGSCGSFTIGNTCHSNLSQSVSETYLLGNTNSITIPATNMVFDDACVGTEKRLYVSANYSQPICSGTIPGVISGTLPTGTVTAYLWESSTSGAAGPFGNAAGTNNTQNYTPTVALTQDTWFRRKVTVNGCTNISGLVLVKVSALPTITHAATAASICQGTISTTLAYTATTGTPTTYSIAWNSTPSNSFLGVANASLNSSPITIAIPSGAAAGTYTGTLTVKNANGCTSAGTNFTVTVNPLPAAAGTISGTSPVCQGQNGVTYSVPAITDATGYTWTLPAGATIASGSNTRTITVNFSATAVTGNITVQGTNSCGNGTVSNNFAVTVNPLPAAAGTITGVSPVCQGQNGVTYSVPAITNATGYTWTLPAGTAIASGANTRTITVNFSATAVTGNITVQGTNSCGNGTVSNNFAVTVNPLPAAAGTISGTSPVCQGQNGVTYSVPAITDATGYTWTLPAGATIASGANTNTITVNFSATAVTGNITVRGTNSCGNGTVSNNFAVTVNPLPAAAGTISGTSPVCQGQNGVSYSVPTIANATGYTWTLPAGAAIASGANTNTITVNFSATAVTGNITVRGTNSCGNGTVSGNFAVTVNPLPAAAGTITGVSPVCQGQNGVTYSVPAITNATGYTWTLPAGATIASGANTNTITVNFSSTAVTGNITVRGTNSCGNGTVSGNFAVTVNPLPAAAGTISGTSPVCQGQNGVTYSVPAITNATGYTWTLPAGATIASGANTRTITVNYSATAVTGNITVQGTNSCGNGIVSGNFAVTVNSMPSTPVASVTTQPNCGVPTGTITVTSPAPAAGITYSINGSVYTNTDGIFTGVAPGSYTVSVRNGSGCTASMAAPLSVTMTGSKVWNGDTSTDWNVSTNWTPNGVPNDGDCVVIPDLTFITNKPAVSGTGAIAFAYSLLVNDKSSLTVNSLSTLKVENAVTVQGDGALVFEDKSSLVQTSNIANIGNITYKRRTKPVRRYDFTYWTAPIYSAAYKLTNLSPATLGDKYYYYDAANSVWKINGKGTMTMERAHGYSVRAPQTYAITGAGQVYEAEFRGVPNNGDISAGTVNGKWNLIGNPYPSAIDAEEFIDLNASLNGIDTGALYFWTHKSLPSDAVDGDAKYNYTSDDYAVLNLTGATVTVPGAEPVDKFIGSAQAFFLYPTGSNTNSITFTNAMRDKVGKNSQFFKTAKTSSIEKNRLWLNLSNAQGAFKQALVGYVQGATNNFDNNFDAVTMSGNTFIDFYTISNSEKLTIQARAIPFDNSEVIPLGYKTTVAGDFTIGIDHVDGLFTSQAVYLEDKTTSKIIDLRTGNYTFKTAIGTFTDRFVLRYTDKTLGTGDFENLENTVVVIVKDKNIKVVSSKENIKDVLVYNIGGQELYNKKKVNASELQITNLQAADQVLLVKITLENGHTVTKKIVFH
ncbi:T9SS sorting signal type C domain-containing protein [Flavobacterium hungaricum]|uniref:SUEL-type lectin domain-containing protein n=1 Tax=Flavobacterium hungaricum TaxID=2082725 RepID=A0ABR9TPZ0_9FLAO|nr:T9SS sorting signal type C domain-containing protein [Flavobacterium hungaricum]MBE8727442.1 hypothetical protein [Flavobacterium hungaricum]